MKNYRLLFVALFLFAVFPLSAQYATIDINQTPQKMATFGNILANDNGVNLTVASATYYNVSSVETPLTLSTPTQVYSQSGYLAGNFILYANGNYSFTPEVNFVGDVNFNYTMSDVNNDEDEASLTIKVIGLIDIDSNNMPIAHNDTAFTIEGGVISSNSLVNDNDPDGNPLTIIGVNQGVLNIPLGFVAVEVSGIDINGIPVPDAGGFMMQDGLGAYSFVPSTGFIGKVDPITYTISDGAGGTTTANIYLRILPDSGSYTFANDDANLESKGIAMSGNVLINDSDPYLFSQKVKAVDVNGAEVFLPSNNTDLVTTIPGKGVFKIKNNGNYSFVPELGFVGSITVGIRVCNDGVPESCDFSYLYLTILDSEELCFEEIAGQTFSWNYQNSSQPEITENMVQPGTNGGFVFDIYRLDNSFNMTINSTLLATQEIQFQVAGTSGQNIRFADGSIWEQGGIPTIWSMVGNSANPILRVVIDVYGNVTMYGSKTSGGPLFPLELFNGNSFNSISWNDIADNDIIVSQNVVGPTRMEGYGYGRNIIPCAPCTLPGNFSSTGLSTNVGVTSLRESNSNNWPQVRDGGWIALESQTKGFVPNRLTATQIAAIPAVELVAGMMVYNITEDCLQINVNGSIGGWQCFTAPGCGE